MLAEAVRSQPELSSTSAARADSPCSSPCKLPRSPGRTEAAGHPDLAIVLALTSSSEVGQEAASHVICGPMFLARLLAAEVPLAMVQSLPCLDFEMQKRVMRFFSEIVCFGSRHGCESLVIDHICNRPEIVHGLLRGCGISQLLTPCANMLRDCARQPALAKLMLKEGVAERLVELARHPDCDVSFEAFESLRELLLKQPAVAAAYIGSSCMEDFFIDFHKLVRTDNDSGYAHRRQSLKLLGDLLLHPEFHRVMNAYVAKAHFLQVHMNLLLDTSRTIQLGAFHIFKVFVANPHKPDAVARILARNRDRLVKLLQVFLGNAGEDENLRSDLRAVIVSLEEYVESPLAGRRS